MNQVDEVIGSSAESVYSDESAILVIEDCEPLLFYLNTALLSLGYEKQFLAGSLAEAQSVWDQHKDEITHVLLNYELPDGLGFDFAAAILKENPSLNIVITSGYDISSVRDSAAESLRVQFLQKPFRLPELKQMIEAPAQTQVFSN